MTRPALFVAACVCVLWGVRPASAQIDPLLFLKSSKPAVIIALDVSSRMQRDLAGRYLDPLVYERTGAEWERSIGVSGSNAARFYRRRYPGLAWLDPDGPARAVASAIEIVGDQQPGFASFDANARLALARAALRRAVEANRHSARVGLVTMRQAAPRFVLDPPSTIVLDRADPLAPTDSEVPATWNAALGSVDARAADVLESGVLVRADDPGSTDAVLGRLARSPLESDALVPASLDGATLGDAALLRLLDDLREEADRIIASDASCRNTVAVLVTGGGEDPAGGSSPASRAAAFLRVRDRRVPLYVVALGPSRTDGDLLRELAVASGARYVEVPAVADAPPAPDSVVTALTAAINFAFQHAFARYSDLNSLPTVSQPLGPSSEFPMAPPIVGTVDLENVVAASGALLPLTRLTTESGVVIPQSSNVLFSAGFTLPGFEASLRAFRVYRPQADPEGPGGYRFIADGTPVWRASCPPPASRNIFTVLPGRGMVPFDTPHVGELAPYLRAEDPAALVAAIRGLPLGAVTTSTPALLTPPLLPGGDARSRAFVEAHRQRRTLLFVGLDDGMMHGFDGRTGLEVWAVIPFNLLPRLRFLLEGQGIDGFQHYVGGSPRLADVLVGGEWRSLLVFGEGAGGTFYQAFDVTLDGAGSALPPGTDRRGDLLGWFADPGRIPFLWSFPSYDHFDAFAGPYGDISGGASELEKSVGQTWSTPAILGIRPEAPSFVLVGSGPLAASAERSANRGGTVAGTRVYLLEARTGAVLDSRDVGSDGEGEGPDSCPTSGCSRFKNALPADPAVVSGAGEGTRAYLGDLDGRLWRFDIGDAGGAPGLSPPRLVFSAGGAHPLQGPVGTIRAGSGATYLFLGTGGDQLPMAADRAPSQILTLLESTTGVARVAELSLESPGAGGLDERLSGVPAIGGEVAFFSATAAPPTGCLPAEARLYALSISGGAAFDTTGDGRRDGRDSPRIASVRVGRATPPTVADRHVFVTAGDRLQIFGDPAGFNAGPGFVGVRVLSWREVGKLPRP